MIFKYIGGGPISSVRDSTHSTPPRHPPTPADVTAVITSGSGTTADGMDGGFASDTSSTANSRPGSRIDSRPDSRLGGGISDGGGGGGSGRNSAVLSTVNYSRRSVVRVAGMSLLTQVRKKTGF